MSASVFEIPAAPERDVERDKLLEGAKLRNTSTFDYIIVGSGAGGGPLAARLALAGKRVLVIEAGSDPAKIKYDPLKSPTPFEGEITRVPGYYAAASEDGEMSWMFSVRHHEDDAIQARDEKYNKSVDPNGGGPIQGKYLDTPGSGGRKQGIFYPRSSGLGGCTAHHAMITIRPNDQDWDDIADLTGDESWRAEAMRGYFGKFERNQYLDVYDNFLRTLLGVFYKAWRRVNLLLDPRAVLDEGGHGRKGWAPTNLIDPLLISTIAKEDQPLIRVIIQAALGTLHGDWPGLAWLKSQLVKSRVVPAIDFNDVNTRRAKPEGVFLIPIGTESGSGEDEGEAGKGRRFSVREFLNATRRKHPDRLIIAQGLHVTRVLFEQDGKDKAPRAIGVECAAGGHLYEASPVQKKAADSQTVRYFIREKGEVVLSGGAFNTPQLLMLSGIGDAGHLAAIASRDNPVNPEACTLRDEQGKLLGGTARRIHLPAVGTNLQDRYEVTVVSELKEDLATLQTVSFIPGDTSDLARQAWLKNRDGLYATNGGTLAVIRRSQAAKDAGQKVPDLFTFGAPAAFRGYYWNWSHELFRRTLGDREDVRRLWSWVILKAYTSNHQGTVRLISADPFEMPQIYFDAFNEHAEKQQPIWEAAWEDAARRREKLELAGQIVPQSLRDECDDLAAKLAANKARLEESRRDLAALVDAVAFMRKVNARNPQQFVHEIQPGEDKADNSEEMKEWVKTQAWGHHCSCTCPIGKDSWQEDTRNLTDNRAVLDSRFRVHGVKGLRVVDASVFPKIPGYFILAPIYMMSEKAADTLLQDSLSPVYPPSFQEAEAQAIRDRRKRAGMKKVDGDDLDLAKPPPRTVGLALSGGGIRSSTFALGVLQALAGHNRLREIDVLSTVSGGGFIGSFLGRLFTRETIKQAGDPAGRVQEMLAKPGSAPLRWLRTQANYIFATGANDLRLNLAVFWRNIFAVYLVIGAVFFALFALLSWLPGGAMAFARRLGEIHTLMAVTPLFAAPVIRGIQLSPWWWLPLLALLLAVLPATLGYWLAPKIGSDRPYPFYSLLAWLVLLAGAVYALQAPHAALIAAVAAKVLILAWVWQEVARWRAIRGEKVCADRRRVGGIVRNRLSRGLGEALFIFAALAGWVVLDTFGLLFARFGPVKALAAATLALTPALPLLRQLAMTAKRQLAPGGNQGFSLIGIANALGIPLAIFLLFVVDVFAHKLVLAYPGCWSLFFIALAFAFSFAIGRAFDFLNLSSLQTTYAARLVRTFQGASSEDRIYGSADSDGGQDVGLAHPKDDIPWHEYHPEQQGGPLHFVNVTVNETVDSASEREIRERKGLPMCLTPFGVSVGRKYFARWTRPDDLPRWQKFRRWLDGVDWADAMPWREKRKCRCESPAAITEEKLPLTALRAVPAPGDPNAFHVLASKASESAEVESLTLGAWIGISGAAFSTGIGRGTKLPLALFMGLTNVRLGYWWDSGIRYAERPGRYPQSIWRNLKRLPVALLRVQSMLLAEWQGRFHGPSRWFWYLSDGGHFEVTGLYEMLRRRLRFMIVTDGGEDEKYQWGDAALLTQQVRQDFRAEIEWLDFTPMHKAEKERFEALSAVGKKMEEENRRTITRSQHLKRRWESILGAYGGVTEGLEDWIKDWIDPDTIGTPNHIQREGEYHAAFARVTYGDSDDVSWILLLKPSLSEGLTQDILNYSAINKSFPQQPTFDQVFDDVQWESYRALGQQIGRQVFRERER